MGRWTGLVGILGLVLFAQLGLGCGGGMAARLTRVAAHDLSCPSSSVHVRDLGLGAWVAIGCARRARYTCARSTCVLQGTDGTGPATSSATESTRRVGPWTCAAHGASATDGERFDEWFERASSWLAECPTRELSLAVDAGGFQVMQADAGQDCAVRALMSAGAISASSYAMRCARP